MTPRIVLFILSWLIISRIAAQTTPPPPPTVTSFAPASLCQGETVVISGTNFLDVKTVAIGSVPVAGFTINNATTITAVVAENAGSGNVVVDGVSSAGVLTVKVAPKPALTDIGTLDAAFSNCNGDLSYTLKVQNSSDVSGANNLYELNWGDGSNIFSQVDWGQGATLNHTYNTQGYFQIILRITPANGCTRERRYQFYNGQNPIGSLTTTNSTTGLCAPAAVEFQIGNWWSNSPGTEYILNYGDGSPLVTLQHPLNNTNSIFKISHTYNRTSCPATDFKAILQARNACFTTTYTLDQIVIRSRPVAEFDVPAQLCVSEPVCVQNRSISGTSGNSCNTNTTYEWDFGDGFTSTLRDPGCHTYAAPGSYRITLKATSSQCGTDTKTKDITVLRTSTPPRATNPEYCRGAQAFPLLATGPNLKWYNAAGALLFGTPIPNTNLPGVTIFYVTQTINGQCESPRTTVTVTVRELPVPPVVTTPVALCQGQAATPLTATGNDLKWFDANGNALPGAPTPVTIATGNTDYYVSQAVNTCEGGKAKVTVNVITVPAAPTVVSPLTYCQGQTSTALTANGTNLKWYDSNGNLLPGAPIPSTATPGTSSYSVAQSNTCGEGPRARITINVTPAPTAAISYTPATLCNAAGSAAVNVTQTGATGGTYSITPGGMTIDRNTGALSPAGATPGNYTVRYTVNGTGGCTTLVVSTTVSVSSTPSASISYPAICAADGVTNVRLTGSVGGVFSAPAGLAIDAATGAITPSGSTAGIYTVTYHIAAAPPCPAFTTTARVVITEAPAATISYTPAALCNTAGSGIVNVIRTGTAGGTYSVSPAGLTIDPVTGALSPAGARAGNYIINYTMVGTGGCRNVTATAIVSVSSTPAATISYPAVCSADGVTNVRLTGSSGGVFSAPAGLLIDAATGAITPSAGTAGSYIVTYKIAAAPPCPEFTTTATVVITQAPAATISYTPASLCNTAGSGVVNVIRTGTAGGRYSVSPAGLSIDPVTGALSPAGARAGNYTISYTMTGLGGCRDVVVTTTVSVNSTPNATISYPAICSADGVTNVRLTGSSGGVFSAPAGLDINAATGAVTPSGSTAGSYIVTYKIAAAPPCPEFNATATVVITQAPAATISYTPFTLCNTPGGATVPVIRTGTAGGTYTIAPAGMAINTLTGELTPADARPGTYTITYTVAGTGGCATFSTNTNVSVSATPVAAIRYNENVYCGNVTLPQPVIQSGNSGGTYSAPAGLILDAVTGAITPAGSVPGNYTVTYSIAPAPPCPGYQAKTNITINERPVINFPLAVQAVCSGEGATFTPVSTVANTTYSWAVSGALPPNVTGDNAGNFTGALGLLFINSGNNDAVITITVSPVNPVTPACPGAPVDIQLTVHPAVYAPLAEDVSICMGAPAVTLQAAPTAGHTLKWYDAQQTLLTTAPVINTSDSLRLQYFVSQQNRFGCEGPKTPVTATVHPTLKITGSDFTHPTECGIPSGTIVLQTRDLNDQVVPNIPVTIYYKKFQTALVATTFTDADGKITLQLTAGSYTDIYAESTGACNTAHLDDVFVLKDPDPPAKPVAGYNPPICSGKPLTLTALSATSPRTGVIEYVWAGPAFGPTPDTVTNTVITFPTTTLADAGTYAVYAVQHNCISAADSFVVHINRSPSIPVISTRAPLCVGDELYLSATSGIADNSSLSFLWTGPGRGFPANGAHVGIDKVVPGDAGRYTVTVTSLESGCGVTADTLIDIGDHPIVQFATDTAIYPTGYKLQLEPVITNAADQGVLPITQYTWTPADNLQCNNTLCDRPVLTVKGDACYKLKVTNSYGCSSTDEMCVKAFCEHAQVFVPNAFSPDGLADNRILMVRATGISTVKSFRIFNRWGKVMYERSNFPPNSTTYGWDGYINGRKADTGVYVYTVEVVCENGITYPVKGNVTLF